MMLSRLLLIQLALMTAGWARLEAPKEETETKTWVQRVDRSGLIEGARSSGKKLEVKEGGLSLQAAVTEAKGLFEKGASTVLIEVAEGVYPNPAPIRIDFTEVKNRQLLIVGKGKKGDVWFEGTVPLDPGAFKVVSDPAELERLAKSARGKIVRQKITDKELVARLENRLLFNIVQDGKAFGPSCFPNEGLATLKPNPVEPEMSPPGVPQDAVDYGVRAGRHPHIEPGRRSGWRGSVAEPRGAVVGFATKEDTMGGTWAQWEKELAANNQRNVLKGFIEANWLLSSQGVAGASAKDQAIRLSRVLSYGWQWKQNNKPFRIFGLLCELDQPGEWYFDTSSNDLYYYPATPLNEKSQVGLAVSQGLLRVESSGVTVKNISARHFGRGTIFDLRGSHSEVIGAVVRDSTALGIRLAGHDNQALDCDLFDLDNHLSLGGGKANPQEIIDGNNLVENCHIYQNQRSDQKVYVSIRGVKNTMRHCLIHNSIGQAVVVHGVDHLLEFNELFNIGYEEGDGGAIYAGGDLAGYGATYRHNFLHHLMHVPGKVERAGIHFDDLQAGGTCIGNIFYKSAAKGIFMNGGAGYTLKNNIFLKGHIPIFNVGHQARRNWERNMRLMNTPNHPERRSKENYLGRAFQKMGATGWKSGPWAERFPRLTKVMSREGEFGRVWPIFIQSIDNGFAENKYNRTVLSRFDPEVRVTCTVQNDFQLRESDFRDYEAFDLQPTHPAFKQIPFEKMGLVRTKARREVPEKKAYRQEVRKFFKGIPSMPGTLKTVNTAEVVVRTIK